MNAEAILIKIGEDARATAAKLQSDAQAKAEEMKATSRAKIEGMHQAMLAQAEKDGAELEQRMLRMAELDDRKALLTQKRTLIDEAFAQASAKLVAASATDKRAFFLTQIVRYADGSETLAIGQTAADWASGNFLAEANEALKLAGKSGNLTLDIATQPEGVGFLLVSHGAEIRCTFDALLDEVRTVLEQTVATELFH